MQGKAAVAAGHPQVVQAAVDVLAEDGNAYDAWIAAIAASCICEPVLASFGGGGFLLASPADGPPAVVDFFTQTPRRRRSSTAQEDFRSVHAQFGTETQEFWIGWGTVAVPGVVAGIFEVHERFGRMPLGDILAPAIDAAKAGVAVTEAQADLFQVVRDAYLATPESRAAFGCKAHSGDVLRNGEVLQVPEFADVLDCLAREGSDLFYRGEIAASIVEASSGSGLQRADLESYAAAVRAPLESVFEGAEVLTNPAPAAGGVLTAVGLGLVDGTGLGDLRQTGDRHARLLAEAIRRTVEVESDAGWDPARGQVDPSLLKQWQASIRNLRRANQGTTHASIIDRYGNVASATVSNGIGSGCMIPDTGIMLNNMLGEAELNPGGLDGWPSDTRLTSMMAPTVVRWPDGTRAAIGSGGSRRIPSAILQVIVNLAAHGMDLDTAINAPRLHVAGNRLGVEYGFDPKELETTLSDWPDHRVWSDRNVYFGGVHAVRASRERTEAHGDPRRGGAAWTDTAAAGG